jgi:hypothetical protein
MFCLLHSLLLCHERLIYNYCRVLFGKTWHWSKIMFISLCIFPNPLPTYVIITQLVMGSGLACGLIKWSSCAGHQNFRDIRCKGEKDYLFCELCSLRNVGNRQFIFSAVLVFLLKVLQLIFIDMYIYWDCYVSIKNNMKTLVNKVEGTFGARDMFCTRQRDG